MVLKSDKKITVGELLDDDDDDDAYNSNNIFNLLADNNILAMY